MKDYFFQVVLFRTTDNLLIIIGIVFWMAVLNIILTLLSLFN